MLRVQEDLFEHIASVNKTLDGCSHEDSFETNACVPSGVFCCECGSIVMRYLPPTKHDPELIGYMTATWAWKYKQGNDWTLDS